MSPDVPATCWPDPASGPSVAVASGSVPAGSVAAGVVAAGAVVPSPPESSSSPHAAAAITRLAASARDRHAQPGEVVAVDADAVRVAAAGGDVLIVAAVDLEGHRLAPAALAELFAHAGA